MTERIKKILLHLNHSKKKSPVVKKRPPEDVCTSAGTFLLTDWASKHLLQSELQLFISRFQLYSDEAQQ